MNEIVIANKSKEQSEAIADASTAEALAVSAEEKAVITARAIEVADRDRHDSSCARGPQGGREEIHRSHRGGGRREESVARPAPMPSARWRRPRPSPTRSRPSACARSGEAEAASLPPQQRGLRNKLGENVINFELAKKRLEVILTAIAEAVGSIASASRISAYLNTGGMLGGGNGAEGGGLGFGDGLAGQLLKLQALRLDGRRDPAPGRPSKPGADPARHPGWKAPPARRCRHRWTGGHDGDTSGGRGEQRSLSSRLMIDTRARRRRRIIRRPLRTRDRDPDAGTNGAVYLTAPLDIPSIKRRWRMMKKKIVGAAIKLAVAIISALHWLPYRPLS